MPDSLVYNFNDNKDDYNDDKQDRSKYVNYLNGNSANDKNGPGLGIPMDVSLAFHTDAGVRHDNKVIGTLALYGDKGENSKTTFPNGVSRLASRDLADLIQTQITEDIRANYDPDWNRRQLMNEQPANDAYPQQYSEVYRPNVPATLIELLSHQNFLDMQFANDPNFRFDVARAMYKGILKFLSVQNDYKFIIQPLPVKSFSAVFNSEGDAVLNWKPEIDTLEPTAKPDGYIIYTRIDSGDFDNGVVATQPNFVIKNVEHNKIYSFKVTAINKGGESFPSEILSICNTGNNEKPVLIVNGFTRVSAPGIVKTDKYQGFVNKIDAGVPYKYDISYTGNQINFNPHAQWVSNDNSGWGDSRANYEDKVIAGNSFDYPYIHGEAIKSTGHSFVSVSVKSVIDGKVDLSNYRIIDLILGKQKTTRWQKDTLKEARFEAFPTQLQNRIKNYLNNGGNIFVSGSYIGSDLFNKSPRDTNSIKFALNTLKYNWASGEADKSGRVKIVDSSFNIAANINYITKPNKYSYFVEAPDEIKSTKESKTILRYAENDFSAGISYKGKYGVIAFGFPFESISDSKTRNELMKSVISYLK